MLQLGWIAYAEPGPLPMLAPAWILALWALFAIALREPLRWLHGGWPLAALLGALGGPLSYAGAERLGACTLNRPLARLALALGWAAITPLLLVLARRWDARSNGIGAADARSLAPLGLAASARDRAADLGGEPAAARREHRRQRRGR